jgi:hypothetical protein
VRMELLARPQVLLVTNKPLMAIPGSE